MRIKEGKGACEVLIYKERSGALHHYDIVISLAIAIQRRVEHICAVFLHCLLPAAHITGFSVRWRVEKIDGWGEVYKFPAPSTLASSPSPLRWPRSEPPFPPMYGSLGSAAVGGLKISGECVMCVRVVFGSKRRCCGVCLGEGAFGRWLLDKCEVCGLCVLCGSCSACGV